MPNTVINGLVEDQSYTFVWTLSNGVCGDYSSDAVQVTIDVANEVAEAGNNIESCDPNNVFLNAVTAGILILLSWD